MICIVCPKGCRLTVDESADPIKVSGASCSRGVDYACSEVRDPRRVLTTTVRVSGGARSRVAVKTCAPIPKPLMFKAMATLADLTVSAPVTLGDVILHNLLDTKIDVIATANCKKDGEL